MVDASVATLLMRVAHGSPLPSRIVSFAAAVTVTWLINWRLAFAGGSTLPANAEYAGYFAIQLMGAAISLGVFMLCLRERPRMVGWPAIPLAAGSAVALLFNFTLSRTTLYSARDAR